MTKTIEIQLEKGRSFVKGLKLHIREMVELGVTNKEVSEFDEQSAEVDKMRTELNVKVKRMNETFMKVKETYSETKNTIKGYYQQERWIDYGIPDKR